MRNSPQGRRRWLRFSDVVTALLIVVLIAGVLELIPADDYMLLPGEAKAVEPMITIPGHPVRHTRGQLYMTDVSLYKVNHLLEEIYGRLNPQADLEKSQDVSGGLPEDQYLALNREMMTDSKNRAEAAALEIVRHYKLHFSTNGPVILYVVPGTPASKVLHAGDRILRLNGKRIHYQAQIPPLVQALRPGQIAHIVFVRHGKRHRVALKTVPSTNGTPNPHGKTALIGILAQDEVKFPIKVRINSGDIGGPSAGLMFALGIVQRLTGKDIAHGCKVAGTGTIDFDGTVGAIGGAKQKVIAARDAGAQYFLVPDVPDNVGPAKTNRGNVKVVPVRTLRQALAFLRTLRPCR